MLLVLWDVDGTLVDTAGHGRFAFEEAFRTVVGRDPVRVDYAGRTDHQIALAMLDGKHDHLPRVLEELAGALEALHARDDVVQSLLTGNIESNAALKVSAFGLERWLDFDVGAYGSDPHERRSDLVAVARERAATKYWDSTGAVLVGDTPLDVQAAHEAQARAVAVMTGFADRQALLRSRPEALLEDYSDTAAAVAAITST